MHVTLGKLTLAGTHRLLCITINQPYPKWAMLKMFHEKKKKGPCGHIHLGPIEYTALSALQSILAHPRL